MTEQDASDPEGTAEDAADGTGTDGSGTDAVGDEGTVSEEPREHASADAEDHADDAATDAEEAVDSAAGALDGVEDELVERVASAAPEEVAKQIASLRVEIDSLEAQLEDRAETVDELESKLARARADFQNYKKRTEERREAERQRATADLVDRVLDVRDNLERALEQDEGTDIRDGVEATLRQLDDVLAAEDVEPIEPAPGEEVDPHRHEVLVRVESDRPEGVIDSLHRTGYEMADTVIREAQVTVSDGSGASADGAESDADSADEPADGADDAPSEDPDDAAAEDAQ